MLLVCCVLSWYCELKKYTVCCTSDHNNNSGFKVVLTFLLDYQLFPQNLSLPALCTDGVHVKDAAS